jgi:hypothetical protein
MAVATALPAHMVRFDVHAANRFIPCLTPLGPVALLLAPLLGTGSAALAMLLLFVLLLHW